MNKGCILFCTLTSDADSNPCVWSFLFGVCLFPLQDFFQSLWLPSMVPEHTSQVTCDSKWSFRCGCEAVVLVSALPWKGLEMSRVYPTPRRVGSSIPAILKISKADLKDWWGHGWSAKLCWVLQGFFYVSTWLYLAVSVLGNSTDGAKQINNVMFFGFPCSELRFWWYNDTFMDYLNVALNTSYCIYQLQMKLTDILL